MKKVANFLLTIIFITFATILNGKNCCSCECGTKSRTTFAVRQQFQAGTPEYITAFRDRMLAREDGRNGSFQVSVFGGKSTEKRKLATYFTPFCKTCLHVKSGEFNGSEDIISQHFNVMTTGDDEFESIISLCPELSVFGIGLTYRQAINCLYDNDENDPNKKHFWIEISAPITRVETNMCLKENILSTKEDPAVIDGLNQTFYANMKDAFNQKAWNFGKINGDCGCSKWGLADITFKAGYDLLRKDCCFLDAYIGFLAPTGNRRCAQYVFEPMVGHAKHWGLIYGSSLRFDVWKDEDKDRILETVFDNHSQYLFKRTECRSFDLKCKPWSRYMEVYENKNQALEAYNISETNPQLNDVYLNLSSPGINVFTQPVCVSPQLSCSSNVALIYTSKKFRGEVGYNFYARQSECIEMPCWKNCAALKAARGAGYTNRLRDINSNLEGTTAPYKPDAFDTTSAVAQYNESIIKLEDIDLESAAHPYFFSHTFYLSLGGKWDERDYPIFIDLGGSYEFGCENAILNRWTLWFKTGCSF